MEAQREAFGYSNLHLTPVRLPFYYSLLSPLARLPYRLALLLWTASTILAAVFFVSLYPGVQRAQFAIASCWSLPLVFSIAIGQDVSFILLILAVTLRTLYAGNPLFAGLILSLCAIKFNLFLLLPLLFVGKREWRLAAGFSIGTVLLLAISFIAGPGWLQSYIALILDPAVDPNSPLMPNVHSLVVHQSQRLLGVPLLHEHHGVLEVGREVAQGELQMWYIGEVTRCTASPPGAMS